MLKKIREYNSFGSSTVFLITFILYFAYFFHRLLTFQTL